MPCLHMDVHIRVMQEQLARWQGAAMLLKFNIEKTYHHHSKQRLPIPLPQPKLRV